MKLLSHPLTFNHPRLLTPPNQFSDLLKRYINETCMYCHKKPKKSAVCLICGQALCMIDFRSPPHNKRPCYGNREGTLKRHTRSCGGSLGIYFILHDVFIAVVHNNQVNFEWGSIYL